jgi:hypothetical protein
MQWCLSIADTVKLVMKPSAAACYADVALFASPQLSADEVWHPVRQRLSAERPVPFLTRCALRART